MDKLSSPHWLSEIDKIIEKMLPKLQDRDGGFKNEEEGKKGCYPTIEGLYPLLLHPRKEKWATNIIDGIKYILRHTSENHGKISPSPEFTDVVEDCSVDSMAYGLYVLALARHYISNYVLKSKEKEKLLSEINTQIKRCIEYIVGNQNRDGGWPFVKDEVSDFKSRIYSTALVIFSLSNCNKTDFKDAKKDATIMIRDGVNFLEKHNRVKGEGWFFSMPRGETNENIRESTTPSVNLTAVVVFSLSHLLRTEFGLDPKVLSLVQEGEKYIYKKTFMDNLDGRSLSVKDDNEPVDYPAFDGTNRGKSIKTNKYAFSYEMILPALVLSPGYSVESQELINLRDFIYDEFKTIERTRTQPWKLYDFSDKIFALLYYNYVETLLRVGIDRFVKASEVIACVIDDYKKCPYVINAHKYSIFQKIRNSVKNRWQKLPRWVRGFLIQFIEVVCTIPILIYMELKPQIPFSLTSNAMWSIYGAIQALITLGLQGYYQAIKYKDRGDIRGEK